MDGEGNPVTRYTATASYTGTASSRYATGYTVSANYTGEVSKANCAVVTYTAIFGSEKAAEESKAPSGDEQHAPGFGTPTSYLPNSGEYLTPNLVPGALSGGLVNQVGSAGANATGGAAGSSIITGEYPSVDTSGNFTVTQIPGSNYVKLRDIGQAVDFSVAYDAATNTVTISPDKPYETEVIPPASTPQDSQTSPSALSKNADGSINVPQDGSQYVPQAGDVIRCDDGTNYTITDVSRYDKNYFADGPVGPLPEATCDWSQFDQPELPKAEVRRFNDPDGDYIFIRNLYETRRMLYSLYNAMGEDDWIIQSGSPRMRGDGTPWVHIHLTLPEDKIGAPFWPWREEAVPEALHSCPGGDYYLEVWDVFKNGKFLRTEYNLR